MAAEQATPTCEISGLPLPILPTEPDARALSLYEDYHHHFHPRKSPELKGIDGKALRYSRGQLIARYLHTRYHQLFEGPSLPATREEKFRSTVLACAGVVPRQAIDLSREGEYRIVTLSNRQFEQLAAPRSIYVERAFSPTHAYYKRRTIGRFFAVYAMQQNVRQAVSDHVIEQFLDPGAEAGRKKELGNFILKEALGMSLEHLIPVHEDLKGEGYITPERQMPLQTIVQKFFTKDFFPDYHDEMAKRLGLRIEMDELELTG
jgi:hypothetical protein